MQCCTVRHTHDGRARAWPCPRLLTLYHLHNASGIHWTGHHDFLAMCCFMLHSASDIVTQLCWLVRATGTLIGTNMVS